MRKHLIFLLLLAMLLCGCAGQDAPETTVPTTAAPTETTVPPTTVQPTTVAPTTEPAPMLRSGYYLLESAVSDGVPADSENIASIKAYLFLDAGGSGYVSILGASLDLTWSEDGTLAMEGMVSCEIDGERIIMDVDLMELTFRYHGDELPEEYVAAKPVGYYLVSSIAVEGDMTIYGALDPVNGYIRLNEDGTGTLFYWGVTADLTMDSQYIYWNGLQVPYIYSDANTSPDGTELLMLYFTEELTSVAMRPAEEPAE